MAGTKQGTENRAIYRIIDADGNYIQVLIETIAGQVKITPIAGISATDVQTALEQIYDKAKNGGKVQSVNGKIGVVTLGASDVNALADTTKYGKTADLTYTSASGVLNLVLKDQDGNQLSTDSVNLPKEMFVQSGSVKTCTQANVPVQGYVVGDKYIELVLNNGTAINVLVSDLVDQVTGNTTGNGNVISSASVSGNTITFTKGITAVTSVNGHTGASVSVTKGDVGLGNVDNTADASKNVASAGKLTTARNIKITGDASGNANFDGSKNIEISVALPNRVTAKNGMSVFNVNAKGLITGTGTLVEFGKSGANTPSADLVVGGLFFELQ